MVVGYLPRAVPLPRRSHAASPHEARSYGTELEQLRLSVERVYVERVRALEERPRFAHLTGSSSNAVKTTSGRERLGRLNEGLNGFGLTRSKGQRDFHRNMTMAVIHKLFKDDFAEHLDYLREQFQTDVFKPEVMIITPRRFGKTYSVAMFVAACAFAIEGSDQAIFSTGRRASKKLLDLIYRFLCKLPGMKEATIVKNVEMIHLQGPGGPDDIRKISSYPSKVRCRRVASSVAAVAVVNGCHVCAAA